MVRFFVKKEKGNHVRLLSFDGEDLIEEVVKQKDTSINIRDNVFAEKFTSRGLIKYDQKQECLDQMVYANEVLIKQNTLIGWVNDKYRRLPIIRFYKT